MSDVRTFSGVTPEILNRMQELGRASYGIVYHPPVGSAGTATSQTPLGQFVFQFVHDDQKGELTLTLMEKPPLLPEQLLWSGFVNTLDSCREPSSQCSSQSVSAPVAPDAHIENESPEYQSTEVRSSQFKINADTSATKADLGEIAVHQSIPRVMRGAAGTQVGHEAKVNQPESEPRPKALDAISRMTYTGSYVLAYGVVYATMFIVRSLPQDNAIMNGLYDGGRAAMNGLNQRASDGMWDFGDIRSG